MGKGFVTLSLSSVIWQVYNVYEAIAAGLFRRWYKFCVSKRGSCIMKITWHVSGLIINFSWNSTWSLTVERVLLVYHNNQRQTGHCKLGLAVHFPWWLLTCSYKKLEYDNMFVHVCKINKNDILAQSLGGPDILLNSLKTITALMTASLSVFMLWFSKRPNCAE